MIAAAAIAAKVRILRMFCPTSPSGSKLDATRRFEVLRCFVPQIEAKTSDLFDEII
jgi:hypothetical protein